MVAIYRINRDYLLFPSDMKIFSLSYPDNSNASLIKLHIYLPD